MNFRTVIAVAAASAAFSGVAHAVQAPTLETFDFKGQCAANDCTGYGTGQLVLQNYVPGTALQAGNFVSFTYSSNLISSLVIGGATGDSYNNDLAGNLGATPGFYDVSFSGNFLGKGYDSFTSSKASPGNWSVTENLVVLDTGTDGVWSLEGATPAGAAPEPEAWALMMAGVAAMGGAIRASRRRQAAAA